MSCHSIKTSKGPALFPMRIRKYNPSKVFIKSEAKVNLRIYVFVPFKSILQYMQKQNRAGMNVLCGQTVAPWMLQILKICKMFHQTQYIMTLIFACRNKHIEERLQNLLIVLKYSFYWLSLTMLVICLLIVWTSVMLLPINISSLSEFTPIITLWSCDQ